MEKSINTVHVVAMATCIVGIVLHILDIPAGCIILAIGSVALLFARVYSRAKATEPNLMRQLSILIFGALLLLGAAYLMHTGREYWLIPLLIDAVVELYISLRME